MASRLQDGGPGGGVTFLGKLSEALQQRGVTVSQARPYFCWTYMNEYTYVHVHIYTYTYNLLVCCLFFFVFLLGCDGHWQAI